MADEEMELLLLKAHRRRVRYHSQKATAWFGGLVVSLPLAPILAIPAVGPTAWDTWMINWQSNLILYFAGLCLVMCLGHSVCLTFRRHGKK